MLFSILQVFILIWIEKSYPLLGESIQNGLFCIFQAIHNFLDLKQKQYNTKVKVKKKKQTYITWSQICSSLLPVCGESASKLFS